MKNLKYKTILLILITLFTPIVNAETRLLIIGDSLTEGYGVAKKDSYPSLLETELKKKRSDIRVINAGSSGSTSAGAFSRLRWHLKSKPKILILALGANDGLRGISPTSTKENLQKAITLAKKNKIIIYLAGMKMPYNYGKDYQKRFENIFSELISFNKIKSIPFLLKDVGGRKHLNLADGIHPNEKGHSIIAKNVASIIEKDL
ncbi:MAG: arylesterase [Bacteriovorax sp. MedPE-SWde]|nr:MAG: arylesterase [Bacteriovorax sp. MedPE-SWde]